MNDTRVAKLARLLVNYSLRLRKGDWVIIKGPAIAEELIQACQVEALVAGAFVSVRASLAETTYVPFRHASEEQLKFIAPNERLEMSRADALLFIWGGWNSKALTGIDPARLALAQAARRPLFDIMLKREASGSLRWVGTQFPTHSSAQDAEMSLTEYQDFVYGAGMLDRPDPVAEWHKVSKRQAGLVKRLSRLSTVRIVGEDTDITFGVKGRKWINCDGRVNFPDGEVFTSPLEDATEGTIRYTFPAVYNGREVENVRLWFKAGRVVDARADKGEEFLVKMLDTDPGARQVGELAFGTNYSIKRFTRNTLFDEKIGGTMHVAIGASLPEAGGKNKSAIHWDMVCDTRSGFLVYGDGKPLMKNGRFVSR
ncbi:MAG: aminopeptidase [candidate division WOR-3 bacterium]